MSKIYVLKRRFVVYISLVVSVLVLGISFVISSVKVNSVDNMGLFTVVIDAGHGGIDNGVVGITSGVKESELNLEIAKLLKRNFTVAGFNVVMTRKTSAGLYGTAHKSLKKTDMQNRKKIIEKAKPNLVVSIHMNYYPSSEERRGAQVFFNCNVLGSEEFANCVQKQLNEMEESKRSFSALKGDYYLLNISPCPAVIVECGFLSNAQDEKLLLDQNYREKLSYTIFKGSIEYLSLSGVFEQTSHLSHENAN